MGEFFSVLLTNKTTFLFTTLLVYLEENLFQQFPLCVSLLKSHINNWLEVEMKLTEKRRECLNVLMTKHQRDNKKEKVCHERLRKIDFP